jgi:DNA polymerase III sliding clamp (beta) subunit (PCNA family)
MSLAGQITNVLDRTQRLIELCEALQDENTLLKTENGDLNAQIDSSKSKVADLEEKIKALKLARSLEGIPVAEIASDEKTLDIKQKINDFVREIDKCIVLLKK